jgi:hypothetical protein
MAIRLPGGHAAHAVGTPGYVDRMGTVLGPFFFPIIIIVIVAAAIALTIARNTRRAREHTDRVADPTHGSLHYLVPAGQDPAVVLLELKRAGYDAVPNPQGGHPSEIAVATPAGGVPEREELRHAIERITRLNIHGDRVGNLPPVRFVDEHA